MEKTEITLTVITITPDSITIETITIVQVKPVEKKVEYDLDLVQDAVRIHEAIEFYKEHSDILCLTEVLVDYGFDADRVGEVLEAFPFLKEEYENA